MKILGVQQVEIYLLLPDLLKDKGRLSAYPLLSHKNYWCIVRQNQRFHSKCLHTLCQNTIPEQLNGFLFYLSFGQGKGKDAPVHIMKVYGGLDVLIHLFSTLALVVGV